MHPLISEIQKGHLKKVPVLAPGYTIQIFQKIKEGGKERIQMFEGLVISVGKGHGIERNITVRKIVEGIGVEKIFPLHSPNVTKIVVKKKSVVRRAKLYYMRSRSGKSARLKEKQMSEDTAEKEAIMEELIQEAVVAEKDLQPETAEAPAIRGDAAPADQAPDEKVK